MKSSKALKVIIVVFAVLLFLMIVVSLFLAHYFKPIGGTPGKALKAEYSAKNEFYYDGQFHNPEDTYHSAPTHPESKLEKPSKTVGAEHISELKRAEKGELKLTWLGHSSSIIQLGDQNILIDPLIVPGSGIRYSALPNRISEYPLDPDSLPDIDVLCISHDHHDHLDFPSIKAIDEKVKEYVVPLGVDVILEGWGVDESKIHVLDWWEDVEIGGVTYTLTHAQHYSGRFGFFKNTTLWGGIYMKDDSHSVYFTGDSGMCSTFAQIYEKFGETDLMLADAGEDYPSWSHMYPDEAVKAAQDVHAHCLVPVHWGAYIYGAIPWYQPAEDTLAEAKKQGITAAAPRIGETLSFDELSGADEHWWDEYK